MTPERLKQIKSWSTYAREDCRHDDNCSNAVKCMPELVKEIERLKALCKRESWVLREAMKRKNNKSMIAAVADTLALETE